MEAKYASTSENATGVLLGNTNPQEFTHSVLPDDFIIELKRQSAEGCLLCWFDTWYSDDWD